MDLAVQQAADEVHPCRLTHTGLCAYCHIHGGSFWLPQHCQNTQHVQSAQLGRPGSTYFVHTAGKDTSISCHFVLFVFGAKTRTTCFLYLFYWADFFWSRTVLTAFCTSILESCIHASPHLLWSFHLCICDRCGTHGYYWETHFWPVSMKKVFLKKASQEVHWYFIDVKFFLCDIQEQPKIQGLSSRGHICQRNWHAVGGLWRVHPLHCHSEILETAQWTDPAQLHHQRGVWPWPVTTVWRNWVRNFLWLQKENFKLED